jgi:hypothetical protein
MGLHEFLAGWFTGTLEDVDSIFARFTEVVHPHFTMIVPSGELLDRETVVDSIRGAHRSAPEGFTIEIQRLVHRWVSGDTLVVTYEEHHRTERETANSRVSTALLVRDATTRGGVQWRHLHETFCSS